MRHRGISSRQWRDAMTAMLLFALATAVVAETLTGRVVSVHDGDTLLVLDKARRHHRIRLAGIDAPELGQPFGRRSKEELARQVVDKSVTIKWRKSDRYGRLVGKVLVGGVDANLTQVSSGMAWHYTEYAKEQSADDRALYTSAEQVAQQESRGLWRDIVPEAPWLYRKRKRELRIP